MILHYKFDNHIKKYEEIAEFIRKEINDNFNVSWWRGLGFAVLIEDVAIDEHKDELVKYI